MRPLPRSGNKYKSVRTVYAGQTYDSKREANYAAELDLRVKAGDIFKWERAPAFPLHVNGALVCSYRPDFAVWTSDMIGTQAEYHEVKGVIAAHSRIKMKLFEALNPNVTLKVVR